MWKNKPIEEGNEVPHEGLCIVVNGVISEKWDSETEAKPTIKDRMIGAFLEEKHGTLDDKSWGELIRCLRGSGVNFQIFDEEVC